jgi:hypothetical protein
MAWYQYNNEYPTNGLPQRIRTLDGKTRTCLWECSESELESLGFSTVSDPPKYDDSFQDLVWDNETSNWSVQITTDPQKISDAWQESEIYKEKLKIKLLEKVSVHLQNGGTISTNFNNALTILDQFNQNNYSHPFDFNWQHPISLGYTDDVIAGIGSTEIRLVHSAFVDFITETYLPNKKY